MSASVVIVSGHSDPASTAPINHQHYARRHGYRYVFDVTPYPARSKYDQKLSAVRANLDRADWLMWIDDDAYMLDLGFALDGLLDVSAEVDFIFCNSPVDADGRWTIVNSGVFLVRNSESARASLAAIAATDLAMVRDWWRPAEHGYFSQGDQDQIVYHLVSQALIGRRALILDYRVMNARIGDFREPAEAHFICHLCGVADKAAAIAELRRRFALDAYLLPPGAIASSDHAWSMFAADKVAARLSARRRSLPRRVVKRLARMVAR